MPRVGFWRTASVAACLVLVAYFWLDRPLSFFAHDHLREYGFFTKLTLLPEFFPPFAVAVFVIVGILNVKDHLSARNWEVAMMCSLGLIVALSLLVFSSRTLNGYSRQQLRLA